MANQTPTLDYFLELSAANASESLWFEWSGLLARPFDLLHDSFCERPGATIVSLYAAWSSRGRNRYDLDAQLRISGVKTARTGRKSEKPPSRVLSAMAKLAATMPISVGDAIELIATLIWTWGGWDKTQSETPFDVGDRARALMSDAGFVQPDSLFAAQLVAKTFAKVLFKKYGKLEDAGFRDRVFYLCDEERISMRRLFSKVAESDGTLIVASTSQVFADGPNEETTGDFFDFLSELCKAKNKLNRCVWVIDGSKLVDRELTPKQRLAQYLQIGEINRRVSAFRALVKIDEEEERRLDGKLRVLVYIGSPMTWPENFLPKRAPSAWVKSPRIRDLIDGDPFLWVSWVDASEKVTFYGLPKKRYVPINSLTAEVAAEIPIEGHSYLLNLPAPDADTSNAQVTIAQGVAGKTNVLEEIRLRLFDLKSLQIWLNNQNVKI